MKKILVIDNDIRFLKMMSKLLESEGIYEVSAESDPLKVIDRVRSFRPDLIMVDIIMPGIGGEELVKKLRDQQDLANISTLFLTGILTASESGNTIKKIGSCYFLPKGLNRDIQLKLIREFIFTDQDALPEIRPADR